MASAAYGSLPFAEQIAFFRQKVGVPTAAWTDLYTAEHDHAFMVAGARGEVLTDMRAAVERFIAEGRTLADFRKDFDSIVARTGWAYNGGRNWRTRVIYETNLRQSYHAGREAQMADPTLRKARPYGLYRHGGSADPRPEHLANDGVVLPLDDPWWDTWSPQNGWGCTCKKYTLSERDLKRMGLQVLDQAPPIEWEEKTVGVRGPSPRTVRVPRGIDPGFEYRPGSRVNQLAMVARKVGDSPADAGKQFVRALVGNELFRRWYSDPVGSFPVARLPDEQAAQINASARYAVLSAETAEKQKRRHPELGAEEYVAIQAAVDRGERLPDGRGFVYILDDEAGYVTVIKGTVSGQALFVQSLRRLSRDEAKRDKEIMRLRKKAEKRHQYQGRISGAE